MIIKLVAEYYSDFKGKVLYDTDSLSVLDIEKIFYLGQRWSYAAYCGHTDGNALPDSRSFGKTG